MIRITLKAILLCFMSIAAYPQDSTSRANYYNAFEEINQMLSGKRASSFKRAVFLAENAYLDNSLAYEGYLTRIDALTRLSRIVAQADGLDYDRKDREQVLLSASIYRVMKDSLVFQDKAGQTRIKEPFEYDIEDFWGEKDWTKMFVTKLLYSQTGNCHSLPALYKILADELGVKAWLAVTPNHTYIKQWSEKTGWYNTELTSGGFPFDSDIKSNGYIKDEAIMSGIYMDTLSVKESLGYVLTDLAQGYVRRFGYSDLSTPMAWLDAVLRYYPDNINAMILGAELRKKELELVMAERKLKNFQMLFKERDVTAKAQALENTYAEIDRLGYRRMPKKMYLNWLYRINDDTTHKPYQFVAQQPFKKYDYSVQVLTAGNGENYEFFDEEDIAKIGTIKLDRKTGKITSYVEYEADEIPDDVISRMYDPALGRFWQIDPLSEMYSPLTPYHFVGNNPINYVDPNGMEVTVSFVGTEARELFEHVINQILGGQFQTTLTEKMDNGKGTGVYSLGFKDSESLGKDKDGNQIKGDVSKLSEGGQEFYNRMKGMIDDPDRVAYLNVDFANPDVNTGNWATQSMDMADVMQYPAFDPSKSEQPGPTQAGKVMHEVTEQYNKANPKKTSGNRGNGTNDHNNAILLGENKVNGNRRWFPDMGVNGQEQRFNMSNGTTVRYKVISNGPVITVTPLPTIKTPPNRASH